MPKRKCSSIDASVGQRMKMYRGKCKYTQQQIAEVLNINRTTYTKYETGISEPSNDLLGKICAIFGVDYNAILGGYDARGVSLEDSDNVNDAFLSDGVLKMNTLSSDERSLIAAFRSLSNEDRTKIIEYVHDIVIDRRENFL